MSKRVSLVVPAYNESILLPRLLDTVDLARQRFTRRRGNGGAALTTAPIVCFVDAEMQVYPDTFNAIESALADSRIVGGASRITMERWSLDDC